MSKYYVEDGNGGVTKIEDTLTWARAFEAADRHIAVDKYGEDNDLRPGVSWMISTVFLGIQHGQDDKGQPLLYETMIFIGSLPEQACWRYATRAEAQAGHTRRHEEWKKRVKRLGKAAFGSWSEKDECPWG